MHKDAERECSNLYDQFTIDECRSFEKLHSEGVSSEAIEKAKKENISEEETIRVYEIAHELHMYFIKGERYIKKEDTIQGWLKRDEEKQDRLDAAVPPKGIVCDTCGVCMNCTDKHLHGENDEPLFLFECSDNHLPRKFVYEGGTRWEKKKEVCPACSTDLDEESVRSDMLITTTLTCATCDYVDTDTLDLSIKEEEEDQNFDTDRKKFCLSKEEGEKYIEGKRNTEALSRLISEQKEKEENKEIYDKVEQLPKLSIPKMKELITKALNIKPYTNLMFEKPIMEQIVSLPFTIEDGETENEHDAKQDLKKLIERTLANTNWRLMSEGVFYRLGILSGRVRVYEKEEDLVKLITKNHVKKR